MDKHVSGIILKKADKNKAVVLNPIDIDKRLKKDRDKLLKKKQKQKTQLYALIHFRKTLSTSPVIELPIQWLCGR